MIHSKSRANLSNHQSVCQMMVLEELHINGEIRLFHIAIGLLSKLNNQNEKKLCSPQP